ncbi:MAG: hypothetical protein FWB85_05285 [Chitinispirillia bacterium]|nr:hypothetical protein [Chitinispirillia bacterium]MCL2241652.1 hypothetical protein [Chitinispirillia bacterium]
MKRMVILLGALAVALPAFMYCAEVKFDNPLDKNGTRYLDGISDDIRKEKGDSILLADYFNPAKNAGWHCDREVWIKTKDGGITGGASTITIYNNEPQIFWKFIADDLGDLADILDWGGGSPGSVSVVMPAKLTTTSGTTVNLPTQGGQSDFTKTPGVGSYVFTYTAKKAEGCGSEDPTTATVQRGLVILEYVAVSTAPPTITLRGDVVENVEDVKQTYVDPGVIVRDGNGRDEIPLTQIVVRDPRNNPTTINQPAGAGSMTAAQITADMLGRIVLSYQSPVSSTLTFTITYHVKSPTNDSTALVERTVKVNPENVAGQASAVIVLNTYTHTVSGRTFQHKDTAVVVGTGVYRELGVKDAYYINSQTQQRVPIPTNLVNISTYTTPGMPGLRSVTYNLPAGVGYASGTATRRVYAHEATGGCDDPLPPLITLNPSDNPLIIPANTPWNMTAADGGWNQDAGWSVSKNPADPNNYTPWRYLVDLGGLTPEKPVPGEYSLLYYSLTECNTKHSVTRTVKVQ